MATPGSDVVLPRMVEGLFAKELEVTPVAVLMGARQTGRSTVVRTLPALRDHLYLTFDDLRPRGDIRT